MTWITWLVAVLGALAVGLAGLAALGASRWAAATQALLSQLEATRRPATAARYDARDL